MLTTLVSLIASTPTFFTLSSGPASFVDPTGKPFLSLGVCCTDPGESWADYNVDNKGYAAFEHFKSGKAWAVQTQKDLKSWGFNSLGGWSDTLLFNKYGGDDRMPYFVVLHLGAYDRAPWHDLFAPEMAAAIDGAAKTQIEPIKSDQKLVGYFTDNELGWWDDTLFLAYFKMPATSPGKQAMVQLAKTHYKTFGAFSTDWSTKAKSFDELGKTTEIHLKPNTNGMQFLNKWIYTLASKYYKLVHDAIRRYDKNHLILGDRYLQYYTIPVVQASKPYVNVVSSNYGAEWNNGGVSHFFLNTLHEVTSKPVMITEFYMAAMENRSGNKNSSGGFPIVQTQKERAEAVKTYLDEVWAKPFMIGTHWFQFFDEPTHGRGDGENYNMGLVDIHGKPYEELLDTFKAFRLPTDRRAPTTPKVMQVPSAPADAADTLRNWNRADGWVPASSPDPIADLYLAQDADHLLVGLLAMDYADESLYAGNRMPESERNQWTIRIKGRKEPIVVRSGGKDQPLLVSAGATATTSGGLKATTIVKILKSSLPNQPFEIESTYHTHSRAESVAWHASAKF